MDLIGRKVEVVEGYYEGIEGVVRGFTLDNYLLIMPASRNGFWAKEKELVVIK